MDNIAGVFSVVIGGSRRDMKVTFGLVERLERRVLKRPIVDLIDEVAQKKFYVSDIATVIHEALIENGDKRLTLEQIGNEVLSQGVVNFASVYGEMLAYALTGGVKQDSTASPDDKKK